MAMIPLQPGILYGPINSRRLGRSLGINLLPTSYKLCSFDCIYCHYGRTRVKTLSPGADHFPAAEQVLQAVRDALETVDIGNHHMVSGYRAALATRLAATTDGLLPNRDGQSDLPDQDDWAPLGQERGRGVTHPGSRSGHNCHSGGEIAHRPSVGGAGRDLRTRRLELQLHEPRAAQRVLPIPRDVDEAELVVEPIGHRHRFEVRIEA